MPRPQSVFVGDVFGRLTVKAKLLNREVACICTCGNVHVTGESHLAQGRTRSCGCLHSDLASKRATVRNTTHGMNKTRVYSIWKSMMTRCYNSRTEAFKNYGGRGITVCKPWHRFENFFADMGEPGPGLTLEREDNFCGYGKDNCQWATYTQQANNKRSNVLMTLNGRTQTVTQWGDELGFDRYVLYERKASGWSDERCLTTPVRKKRK